MQSARVPTAVALRPTGIPAAASPNEAPDVGPLEVYPQDDAPRYKSPKSNRRANCDVPAGAAPLFLARRGLSNTFFHARLPRVVVTSPSRWRPAGVVRAGRERRHLLGRRAWRPLGQRAASFECYDAEIW